MLIAGRACPIRSHFGRLASEPLASSTTENLAPVPTLTWEAIKPVPIVITTPVAAVLIAIRTAIDRRVPGWAEHGNCRSIHPHSQIRVCFRRNAGTDTRNHKSGTYCNR